MQEYDDEWAENEDLAYTWGITEGFKQRFDAGFQVRGRTARGGGVPGDGGTVRLWDALGSPVKEGRTPSAR